MIKGVNEKTREQLLEEFAQHTSHDTLEGEQYTAAIIVKSAADMGGNLWTVPNGANLSVSPLFS